MREIKINDPDAPADSRFCDISVKDGVFKIQIIDDKGASMSDMTIERVGITVVKITVDKEVVYERGGGE